MLGFTFLNQLLSFSKHGFTPVQVIRDLIFTKAGVMIVSTDGGQSQNNGASGGILLFTAL